MIVADTDVLIDYLRGKGLAERIAIEIRSGDLHTTVITAFELLAGSRSKKESVAVDTLLAALVILPLDLAATHRSGEIHKDLTSKGITIGMADSLIAGICLERNATLITRNVRHFEKVSGLDFESSNEKD